MTVASSPEGVRRSKTIENARRGAVEVFARGTKGSPLEVERSALRPIRASKVLTSRSEPMRRRQISAALIDSLPDRKPMQSLPRVSRDRIIFACSVRLLT